MREFIGFNLSGANIDKLSETLQLIGQDMKLKSGRFALRKAAEVIAEQVRVNAMRVDDPKTPEKIYLNVDSRWNGRRYRANGDLAFRIGIMGGAGGNKTASELAANPGGDTRHWRYVEFGTQEHPPNPFFRKSLQEAADQAISTFVTNYQKSIDRAIKRTGGVD